ncbi:MAG: serine/threonine protein kinase [Candidatus Melainabacteria bacterium]|jgi:serine/threonine protein kinase|nr:serine/threonine protein kinase [Candidatus Melainabacteria bacterium]
MPDEPITPTREMRVASPQSDAEALPRLEIGPESSNRQKTHLPEKTVLAERWEVMEFLGEGGMSSVYKMRHLAMGRFAAAKILHPHLSFDDRHLQRFQREAQAASAISHNNVINIYDCGLTPDGRPFILMEYLPGKSLADELKEKGKLPLERALEIFLAICDGMGHAHEKGVVHRDLKPSNVMLVPAPDGKEIAKVVDFGIARMIPSEGADGEAMHQLTQTGEVFGSPLYMSPEQCLGKHPDQRSDVYAMGCLMYEVLSGSPPFKGESFLETMHMQLEENAKPFVKNALPNSNEKVLQGIVLKCLAKNPNDRYGNMHELRNDLACICKGGSALGFLKTRAGRELFKRFQTEKKKEIGFIRLVAIIAIVLLPLSLFLAMQSLILSLYEEIPTGINQVHNAYWPRPYLSKRLTQEEERVALQAPQKAINLFGDTEFKNSPLTNVEEYSRMLRKTAEVQFECGQYAEANKNLGKLVAARHGVYGDQDPMICFAKLTQGKCLYFLDQYPQAERAFVSALSMPVEYAVQKNKVSFLEGLDIYCEMMLKSPKPDYERLAYFYQTGANWANSSDPITEGTPKNLNFYYMFANLRADAMRILGDPNNIHEKAYVAKFNEVHTDEPDVRLEKERKRDKKLGLIKRLSPMLWQTRQVYKELQASMDSNGANALQRTMFWWGKGCVDQKFGILRAKSELEEALKYLPQAKLERSKEVEAQIRKDIILLNEKSNPLLSFFSKSQAVNLWRSREVKQ